LKSVFPSWHRGLWLRLATLCVTAAVSLNTSGVELNFDQVFSAWGEPGALHYRAIFVSKGLEHQLEVWRDGDRRLRRRTDDAIETYAFHKPGDPEFQMSILDMKKRIHTRIDRTNLYRIGNFTDWFDLAHGLRRPLGEYRIAVAHAPDGAPRAVNACQWYDLNQERRATHICWSAQSHLPLVIQAQDGTVVWRVATLDGQPIPAKTFEIHDEGFIRNDANLDIESD
jgi:hypothetical protein